MNLWSEGKFNALSSLKNELLEVGEDITEAMILKFFEIMDK